MKLFGGSGSGSGQGKSKGKGDGISSTSLETSDHSHGTGTGTGTAVSAGNRSGHMRVVARTLPHLPGARKSARDRLDKHVEKKRWDRLEELLAGVERVRLMQVQMRNGVGVGVGAPPPPSSSLSAAAADREEIPEELSDPDERGRTLLHSLCSEPDCPATLIESLAIIAPRTVSKRDREGFTPLHCAIAVGDRGNSHRKDKRCKYRAIPSLDVVRILISVDLRCASRRDAEGRTPIFLACEEIARHRLIAATSSSSSGLASLQKRGSAHLRRFVGGGSKSPKMGEGGGGTEKETKTATASASTSTEEGQEEIERLADIIEYIASTCPDCVHIEDDSERTPLERAISAEAPKRAILALKSFGNKRAIRAGAGKEKGGGS